MSEAYLKAEREYDEECREIERKHRILIKTLMIGWGACLGGPALILFGMASLIQGGVI